MEVPGRPRAAPVVHLAEPMGPPAEAQTPGTKPATISPSVPTTREVPSVCQSKKGGCVFKGKLINRSAWSEDRSQSRAWNSTPAPAVWLSGTVTAAHRSVPHHVVQTGDSHHTADLSPQRVWDFLSGMLTSELSNRDAGLQPLPVLVTGVEGTPRGPARWSRLLPKALLGDHDLVFRR